MVTRFQEAYLEGTPPWDIGRPQVEVVRLGEVGEIRGRVIDVGCGSGEHSLYLAGLGHDVLGVDLAPEAIRQAKAKAVARRSAARFEVADVLDLNSYTDGFDTAIDSGVFHVFDDASRPLYARSVGAVLHSGGRLFLLCFSEHQPGDWGPRRVTQAEIRSAFTDGWRVDDIRGAAFDTILDDAPKVQAWLATLTRTVT